MENKPNLENQKSQKLNFIKDSLNEYIVRLDGYTIESDFNEINGRLSDSTILAFMTSDYYGSMDIIKKFPYINQKKSFYEKVYNKVKEEIPELEKQWYNILYYNDYFGLFGENRLWISYILLPGFYQILEYYKEKGIEGIKDYYNSLLNKKPNLKRINEVSKDYFKVSNNQQLNSTDLYLDYIIQMGQKSVTINDWLNKIADIDLDGWEKYYYKENYNEDDYEFDSTHYYSEFEKLGQKEMSNYMSNYLYGATIKYNYDTYLIKNENNILVLLLEIIASDDSFTEYYYYNISFDVKENPMQIMDIKEITNSDEIYSIEVKSKIDRKYTKVLIRNIIQAIKDKKFKVKYDGPILSINKNWKAENLYRQEKSIVDNYIENKKKTKMEK